MKSMDRGPALPPAAKARAERNAQRRAARATAPVVAFTPRFIVTSALIAVAAGFLASAAGTEITRTHLLRAIRREYEKSGRAFPGLPAGMAGL